MDVVSSFESDSSDSWSLIDLANEQPIPKESKKICAKGDEDCSQGELISKEPLILLGEVKNNEVPKNIKKDDVNVASSFGNFGNPLNFEILLQNGIYQDYNMKKKSESNFGLLTLDRPKKGDLEVKDLEEDTDGISVISESEYNDIKLNAYESDEALDEKPSDSDVTEKLPSNTLRRKRKIPKLDYRESSEESMNSDTVPHKLFSPKSIIFKRGENAGLRKLYRTPAINKPAPRNNFITSLFIIIVGITLAGMVCIAIGHFLGVQDTEFLTGNMAETLKKLQKENVLLQTRLTKLNRAIISRGSNLPDPNLEDEASGTKNSQVKENNPNEYEIIADDYARDGKIDLSKFFDDPSSALNNEDVTAGNERLFSSGSPGPFKFFNISKYLEEYKRSENEARLALQALEDLSKVKISEGDKKMERDDKKATKNYEKSDTESNEKSTETNDVKSDVENDEKSAEKNDGKSDIESDEKSAEKNDGKSDMESDEKSAEKNDGKSDMESDEKSAVKNDGKSDVENDEKSAEKNDEKSAEKNDGKSDMESDEKSAVKNDGKSGMENDEKSAEKNDGKSDMESDEKSAKNNGEKSDVEKDGKSAKNNGEKSDVEKDGKSAKNNGEKSDVEKDGKSAKKNNQKPAKTAGVKHAKKIRTVVIQKIEISVTKKRVKIPFNKDTEQKIERYEKVIEKETDTTIEERLEKKLDDKPGEKVNEKVNEKVDEKVDEKLDEKLDREENKINHKPNVDPDAEVCLVRSPKVQRGDSQNGNCLNIDNKSIFHRFLENSKQKSPVLKVEIVKTQSEPENLDKVQSNINCTENLKECTAVVIYEPKEEDFEGFDDTYFDIDSDFEFWPFSYLANLFNFGHDSSENDADKESGKNPEINQDNPVDPVNLVNPERIEPKLIRSSTIPDNYRPEEKRETENEGHEIFNEEYDDKYLTLFQIVDNGVDYNKGEIKGCLKNKYGQCDKAKFVEVFTQSSEKSEEHIGNFSKDEDPKKKDSTNKYPQNEDLDDDRINEGLKYDDFKREGLKNECPKNEEIEHEDPKYDDLKNGDSKNDDPKYDDLKNGDSKNEDPKYDDLKNGDSKNDDPKYDDLKNGDSKNDDPKYDDLKNGDSKNDDPKYDDLKNGDYKKEDSKIGYPISEFLRYSHSDNKDPKYDGGKNKDSEDEYQINEDPESEIAISEDDDYDNPNSEYPKIGYQISEDLKYDDLKIGEYKKEDSKIGYPINEDLRYSHSDNKDPKYDGGKNEDSKNEDLKSEIAINEDAKYDHPENGDYKKEDSKVGYPISEDPKYDDPKDVELKSEDEMYDDPKDGYREYNDPKNGDYKKEDSKAGYPISEDQKYADSIIEDEKYDDPKNGYPKYDGPNKVERKSEGEEYNDPKNGYQKSENLKREDPKREYQKNRDVKSEYPKRGGPKNEGSKYEDPKKKKSEFLKKDDFKNYSKKNNGNSKYNKKNQRSKMCMYKDKGNRSKEMKACSIKPTSQYGNESECINLNYKSGDWFLDRAEGREKCRRDQKISDWQFERAKSRANSRIGDAFWQFSRAHARQNKRMHPYIRKKKSRYYYHKGFSFKWYSNM